MAVIGRNSPGTAVQIEQTDTPLALIETGPEHEMRPRLGVEVRLIEIN